MSLNLEYLRAMYPEWFPESSTSVDIVLITILFLALFLILIIHLYTRFIRNKLDFELM
jgi:hypothetical protein